MQYELEFIDDFGYETELRAMFGVTEDELPNDMINTDIVIGRAERYVLGLVPGWNALTDAKTFDLYMATLNMAAYYAVPILKLRLLQTETDNKSTATRFSKALDALDAARFKGEADKIIGDITGTVAASVSILSGVMPAVDPVTGTDPSSYR